MRVIIWRLALLLSTLLPSTGAVAQTKPTIPQTGRDAQGQSFTTLRDLGGVFSLYADYSALQAEIARALAAESGLVANKASATNGTLTNPTILGGATVNGPLIWLNPSPTQNATYAAGGLTNGVIIGAGGNTVSYCPVFACVLSPSAEHQRANVVIWSTTGDDNHSEEQTVAIETIINDGAYKVWHPNTAYAIGDNLAVFANNAVYRATTAGRSAGSGSGPVGTGAAIVDGTVVWQWINESAILAKVGSYEETVVNGPSSGHAGAGQSWGRAANFGLQPGAVPSFDVGYEQDFSNNSGTDCVPGTSNCIAIQIFMGGSNYSTAALAIGHSATLPTSYNPALFGVYLADKVAIQAALEVDDIGSQYGLAFGKFQTNSTHTVATISDASTSPTSLAVSGVHSSQVIADASVSPALLNGAGQYALAALRLTDATTPNALLAKHDQKICFNDTDACLSYNLSAHKLVYTVGGVAIFSVSDNGNAIFRGTVTSNGTP